MIACSLVSAHGRLERFAKIAQPVSGGVSALSGFSLIALYDDPKVTKAAYYSVFGVWTGPFIAFISVQAYLIRADKRGTYILTCIVIDTLLVATFSLSTLSVLNIMTAYTPLLSTVTAFVAYYYFPKSPARGLQSLRTDDETGNIRLGSVVPSGRLTEDEASTEVVSHISNRTDQGRYEALDHRGESQEADGNPILMSSPQDPDSQTLPQELDSQTAPQQLAS